jgi:hypothetical protein
MVAIRWGREHSLDRVALKAQLDRDVRIGRHQLSIPISGPPDGWLRHLRNILEIAARIEGAR